MTAYQKHWNAEIELLLRQLDAPQSLEDNIVDTLNNKRGTPLALQVLRLSNRARKNGAA